MRETTFIINEIHKSKEPATRSKVLKRAISRIFFAKYEEIISLKATKK